MSFEPPELLAGLGVPQPGRPVLRACQDLPAVRTKGYGKDPAGSLPYVLRTAGAAGRFGRPTAGPSCPSSLSGPAGRPD
jgi:hypothetical protein